MAGVLLAWYDAATVVSEIRPARPGDVEQIVSCVRAAYAVYVPRIGREPAPMTADYADLVARGRVWLTDDVSGVLVAYARDDGLFVETVAVRPADQGRGLGGRLLRYAEELCRSAGLREVRLYTHELMTENLAMYTHLGYREYDRRTEDGFQRVYLRKPLAPA